MKCWFCDAEANGVCQICGVVVCENHSFVRESLRIAELVGVDRSGYTTYKYHTVKELRCCSCK